MTSNSVWDWSVNPFIDLARNDDTRNLLNQMSANLAATFGAAGFFSARPLMPWLQPGGTLAATSFYDTNHLKHTLERLVDFDRLNAGMTRFSAGAVTLTLAHIGTSSEWWRKSFAMLGAIIVGSTAWARLSMQTEPAPRGMPHPGSSRVTDWGQGPKAGDSWGPSSPVGD